MILNKIKNLLFIIPGLVVFVSCKKQLDINDNPNNPVKVPLTTLLTNAEVALGTSLAMGTGLSQDLAVYTHQMSTREEANDYAVT